MVNFENIKIGGLYDRNTLTELWKYQGRQAISRGVVTPAGTKTIILFVTKEKQAGATPYVDYISENYLYWEGEEKGANNNRIINSAVNNDLIYLFYRRKHRENFRFMGNVKLAEDPITTKLPFQFIFEIIGNSPEILTNYVQEPTYLYFGQETQKRSIALSRIGQGKFRSDLFNMWEACAITNVEVPELLKASHIKPWRDASNSERLDPYNGLLLTPTLDALFDNGFISFENNGQIILSDQIQKVSKPLNLFGEMKLRRSYQSSSQYLEYHRDVVFLG